MRATEIEFRLRMVIIAAIVMLGFWAPWIGEGDLGKRISLLEWLALEASRTGMLRFTYATPVVIVLGALLGLIGAVLRVWGAAYLGYATVQGSRMQAGWVMADGPYRYMRNPLYVGSWFTLSATALVMPPTGAFLAIVLLTVFYLRLTLGEEAFLSATLGAPYRDYLGSVPRFFPRLRGSLPPAGNKPRWFTALFTELFPIGVFITLAVLAWRYDHQLMLEGIFWSFVASLIARGFMKALIPTLAFVAFFAIATEWFHMDWPKAALIGLGIALIVEAVFFGAKKAKEAQTA
ncbi:MAG: isoprenylcysteine carboxylmethyltransferase family protein [Terracidiphilus sp.]